MFGNTDRGSDSAIFIFASLDPQLGSIIKKKKKEFAPYEQTDPNFRGLLQMFPFVKMIEKQRGTCISIHLKLYCKRSKYYQIHELTRLQLCIIMLVSTVKVYISYCKVCTKMKSTHIRSCKFAHTNQTSFTNSPYFHRSA